MRCRSLAQETESAACRADALRAALSSEDSAANAALYVLLRAVDRFHATCQRYPGSFDRWVVWQGRAVRRCNRAGQGPVGCCAAGGSLPVPRLVPAHDSPALLVPFRLPWRRSEVEEDAALLKSQANALLAECGISGAGGETRDRGTRTCRTG